MSRTDAAPADDRIEFLSGGGAAGQLMREHDWSDSPLGPPRTWPQALRTVVALMLNSKFPMFVAWGPELGFLYNEPYIDVLGAKHPSSMGRRMADVWSEIWDDIGPLAERALNGEASYRTDLPLRMKRHGYEEDTWFTFSYSPIRGDSGAIEGVYCACVETTAQVLAQTYRNEENKRLTDLFEQAPGIIAVLRSPEHVYELTNKSYRQLLGGRQLIGLNVRQAIPELEGQGFYELLDSVYQSGEPFVGRASHLRIQTEPGGPLVDRYIDFIYQPIRNAAGMVEGIFVEGSDVTSRKKIEDELRAANRQKDQFLAMLAHELRNPLAPITSAAQLLKLGTLDAKAARHASEIIARQAEHMTALVNDLLDVSRVTRGLVTLEKTELDVNAVVASAVEQVRPLIESKRHSLTLQLSGEPARVLGDRTRLVQVVSNLLNNAAKYTPSGGRIALDVGIKDRKVEVRVRDNGVGIEDDVLPYIFELFTQAERSPDRSQGGLGIGLALVKSLVILHGGRVEALSDGPGQGSEFVVCLPRIDKASTPAGSVPEPADQAAGQAPLRVLIVDDNVDAAAMLATLLELDGHEVSVEHDGRSGLQRARLDRPQVLLLDIGLPDMDGYQLAREVRKLPDLAGAVLVALTGYGQGQDRLEAERSGFDHHLVKPASMERISEILAQAREHVRAAG
jgi:signal transduction histidine kinase/ActR/RegA family two-component response regulator